jgi:hypothetical protein
LALGSQLFAELALDDDAFRNAGIAVGVSLARVGVRYLRSPTVRRAGAAAHFELATLDLEGCLVGLRVASRATTHLCFAFDAGVLRGQGEDAPLTRAPMQPWFDVSPRLRLEWFFHRSWFLDLQANVVVPLRRDTFWFDDPPTIFHEVPAWGAGGGIGLGYELGGRVAGLRP